MAYGMGSRVKELREMLNMTQQDFAERIEVTQSNLSNYEKKDVLTLNILLKIAETFDVSMDWLCGLSDDLPKMKEQKNNYSDYFKLLTTTLEKLDMYIYECEQYCNYAIYSRDELSKDFLRRYAALKALNTNSVLDNENFSMVMDGISKSYDYELGVGLYYTLDDLKKNEIHSLAELPEGALTIKEQKEKSENYEF